MSDLRIRLLQHALIIVLVFSCLFASTFLMLMFIPPFALFGWIFSPIVVGCGIVGAYSIVWLIYLFFGQTDRKFKVPYNPKRIIKLNYELFRMIWTSFFYLPLVAEYWYQRFFVLREKHQLIIKQDIYYGSETKTNRLDVYIPDTAILQQQFSYTATHTVIVFIYGGAWSTGNKKLYALLALRLRHLGYVVVIPDFTLYPNGKVDAMISDVKRSLIWTSKYINNYGGDPNKIYLMGHSSGAHLASLVTIRDAIIKSEAIESRVNSNLKDIDPELELPKIHGLILLAGVFDLSKQFLRESERGVEEVSALARAMGNTQEGFDLNSPEVLLKNALTSNDINLDQLKSLIPSKILFIHGDKDRTVLLDQSLRLNYLLNQFCIKDLRLRMPVGMGHDEPITGFMYSPLKNRYTSQLMYDLADFMSC